MSDCAAGRPRRLVAATKAPPPFDPVYFDTVFLVPCPPARWPGVFAIVTAHNPDAELASGQANNEYEQALSGYLQREGVESFPVVGASPDLGHHESGRGFAVGDLERAAAISARFRQAAFFLVEDGTVFICTDASGEGWELGRWEDRLVSTRP